MDVQAHTLRDLINGRKKLRTMRTKLKIIFIILLLQLLSSSGLSQTPQEQLSQLVAQLQKRPTDDAMREKIIKLAVTMKPAPALPDEALRHEGRGNAAFKNAKAVEDFIAAAKEFDAASLVAPWVAGYYSDMCTAYEKGGALAEAYRSCWLYSLALTDEKEIREAKLRTAAIEYEYQKYSGAELQKLNNSKKPFGSVPGMPSGKLFFCNNNNYQTGTDVFSLGKDNLAPYGRYEIWLVQNGSKVSEVVMFWVSTESFSELMKAGIVIKNPLIKEFPATAESDSKNPTFSTNSPYAPVIQFLPDYSFAVTLNYSNGLGRPPFVNGVYDPFP